MLWVVVAAVLLGYMRLRGSVSGVCREKTELFWSELGIFWPRTEPCGTPVQGKNDEIAVTAAKFQLEIWSLSVKELSWTGSVDFSMGLKIGEGILTFVIWVVENKGVRKLLDV